MMNVNEVAVLEVTDWTACGNGEYRVYGWFGSSGFYANVKLSFGEWVRGEWTAVIVKPGNVPEFQYEELKAATIAAIVN